MWADVEGRSFSLDPGTTFLIEQGTPREEQVKLVAFFWVQIESDYWLAAHFRPIGAASLFPHPDGAPLSNVRLGNPGSQGTIDVNAPNYKAVVPLATVLE